MAEIAGIALAVAGLLCTIVVDGTAFCEQMHDNSGQLNSLFEQLRALASLVRSVGDHIKSEFGDVAQLPRSHPCYEIGQIIRSLEQRLPCLQPHLHFLMREQPVTWLGRRVMQRKRRHSIERIKEARDRMQSDVTAIQTYLLMTIEYVNFLHSPQASPLLTWPCSNSRLQASRILRQAPLPPIRQITSDIQETIDEPDMEAKRTEDIFNAVKGRDLEKVRRLLWDDKMLSGTQTSQLAKAKRNGQTLLDCALDGKPTWNRRYELIDLLVSHGAEVATQGQKFQESQRVMKMMWNSEYSAVCDVTRVRIHKEEYAINPALGTA